ncbi:MAG: hypothetical protein LUG95_05540 [Clostridiales bacterium]|nr:hypothetical protein [Clostridiales bacterium]
MHRAENRISQAAHGEAMEELNELPHLKARPLKLAAVLIFIIVLVIFVLVFTHTVISQNEKNDTFCTDAANICTEYIKEYGSVKWRSLDETKYGENKARLTGLCYARQMDFDDDGSDELMLCYYDSNVYYLEVWGYSHNDFVRFYSGEANSTSDDTDGSRASFYHKGNKYYICKSEKDEPEKVTLYSLHGDGFKESSKQYDYDHENDIYYDDGEINSTDFETVRLSVLRQSKAETVVDTVTGNIDSFGDILSQAITSRTEEDLISDAYYSVVKKRLDKYGVPEIKSEDGYSYINGVAYVRLIDFNRDSNDELVIVYRKYKSKSKYDSYPGEYIYYDVPIYGIEVYDFDGSSACRLFSKETVSNGLEDENIFYLILKTEEKHTDICSNVYTVDNSYNYTTSSKIYKLSSERFETIYNSKVENDYGYKRYYIDGERVYNTYEFEESGYKVPPLSRRQRNI